ncbi:Uncharacterized oxidoreductase Mjls_1918 [Durusdinium trenchii]|uniref:Uncharacterized oxidoreductase Mjls_1918 n=1 Tax=Durusdinium trenchii TaxID=1381693 RepID=A0ABP0KGG0_9DINO
MAPGYTLTFGEGFWWFQQTKVDRIRIRRSGRRRRHVMSEWDVLLGSSLDGFPGSFLDGFRGPRDESESGPGPLRRYGTRGRGGRGARRRAAPGGGQSSPQKNEAARDRRVRRPPSATHAQNQSFQVGLEDTPAVLLGLMARYACRAQRSFAQLGFRSSNAQLALRCDPGDTDCAELGDRERRAETARLVTSRLDVAQQALRSRQPDGELLIQAAARELVQTIAKVHMPHSCSVPLRVVPVKGRHEGSVPLIGFGTHELRALECYSAVRSALEAGVRHIDTAENYGNAEDLARAMRDSEVPREEIFVATKLSSTGLDQASSYRALASELQRLGGAADLCYLHFPSEKNLPAWRALEQLQQEGRCRQLGLSNFGRAELQQIWEHGQVKPVALQIQFSIYEPPSNAFLRWLAALPGKGLTVVAASTLNPEATGALNPMEDPHVQQIAARHDKSSAQVLLRWLVQQKVAVLPRSRQKQHIQENCDLDFVLTDHEMTHLSGLATLAQDLGAAEDSVRPEGAVDVFGLRGMS